jgi:TonB-dependent Receptor Plug Domain
MQHTRLASSLLALSGLTFGCATTQSFDRTTEPGGKPLGTTTAGTVVITREVLADQAGRTVLEVIRQSMPQLQISGWTANRCPMVELRGKDSIVGNSDPDVYVDGTRTTDTCPLVTLQAIQADRIEVYPMGVTPRPGYSSRGHGLILIFLQRAGDLGS